MTVDKDVLSLMESIKKHYKDSSIIKLANAGDDFKLDFVTTGSLKLDRILGGGFPLGRTIEIYGPQMSGKSSIMYLAMGNVQRREKQNHAAIIDAEHTFNPALAAAYGVDIDSLVVVQPSTGEDALDIAETLVRSGKFGIVGIDSVSALVPKDEESGEMGKQYMGLQSRLMSKACRKLTHPAYANKCAVIFINQIREKIGVMFGNPETTSGGRALGYFASVRARVTMGDKLKVGEDVVGHIVRVKIEKNKVSAPFMETEFNLFYGVGVDTAAELADLGAKFELIKQAGAWYSIMDKETGEVMLHPSTQQPLKWQGGSAMQDAFREDEWLQNYMKELIAKYENAAA